MTVNSAFKKSVKLFASLNRISYTTALREFDLTTGRLIAANRNVDPGPDEAAEVDWAAKRGLVLTHARQCFHQLSSASGQGGIGHQYEAFSMGCSFQDDMATVVKDHARAYLFRGRKDRRRRLAVVTFAPYKRWGSPRLQEEVRRIVVEHDLKVRVGMRTDATYGSGTIPIVFWNPRVIDLS